jgi:hypothetical protein
MDFNILTHVHRRCRHLDSSGVLVVQRTGRGSCQTDQCTRKDRRYNWPDRYICLAADQYFVVLSIR